MLGLTACGSSALLLYASLAAGLGSPPVVAWEAPQSEYASTRPPPFRQSAPVGPLSKREPTNADVCQRYAQQAAVVNGTAYFYGGQHQLRPGQVVNLWNNDFLSLDLERSWDTTPNPLRGLPRPSYLPEVANGYLWASYESLYLYGGEYSDAPFKQPTSPFSLWEYHIPTSSWINHPNPTTSKGVNAPDGGVPVLDAAEGSGFSVAQLGRGFYFGGHEDTHTVYQWDHTIARIYLKSLLEFTFPGFENPEVYSLGKGKPAGPDGVWRNITKGTGTTGYGFPERADGVLVWVPGFSPEGVLLGLAGGSKKLYTEMNVIDVYDIATSRWYQQATSGKAPSFRVNPCAVVAAAADGSSYNVYLFGGQTLGQPNVQQQFNDMWILTVPSFTWIKVDQAGQSVPPPRAGQTCSIWDSQMIVVGGYVPEVECDSPGIYVFDASDLVWRTRYTSVSKKKTNPLSEQVAQIGKPMAMPGSYDYKVPSVVQKVVGGGPYGGATVTRPASAATGGPFLHGSPPDFPVHNHPNGLTSSSGISESARIGAIVAGVIAGILLIVAIYLGFIAWLYRKRLREYKANVDTLGWNPGQEKSRGRSRSGLKYTAGGVEEPTVRRSSSADLLAGKEPTFVGIMLHPRRSLRVVNPD